MAFSLTAFSLLCTERVSDQTCQKFLRGWWAGLANLESIPQPCVMILKLSVSSRERSVWVFSDSRRPEVFLPTTFWKRKGNVNVGGSLKGHLRMTALGKTLEASSVVSSETTRGSPAGERLGHQSTWNTETSLGKLEFWCQLTQLSALTFYIIRDEDVGSTSAEEDGATTDGDPPATRPYMRVPLV